MQAPSQPSPALIQEYRFVPDANYSDRLQYHLDEIRKNLKGKVEPWTPRTYTVEIDDEVFKVHTGATLEPILRTDDVNSEEIHKDEKGNLFKLGNILLTVHSMHWVPQRTEGAILNLF